MEPIQFLLNMVSLINFPLAMRPLLQENLQITDEVYQQLLKDRKEIVLKTLFKN
jgi:TetR/AcrR family transcriptional regulator